MLREISEKINEASGGRKLTPIIKSFSELSSVISNFKRGLTKPETKTLYVVKTWGHLTNPDIKLGESFFSAIKQLARAKINLVTLFSGSLSDDEKAKFFKMKFEKDSASAGRLITTFVKGGWVDSDKVQMITKTMVYAKPLIMEPFVPKQHRNLVVDQKSNRVYGD